MTRLLAPLGLAFALSSVPAIFSAQPAAVPAPDSVIGFPACADRKLATYEQIAEYFHRLDAASDRIVLREIGETAEGRTQLMAIISAEENLRQLERYQRIAQRLALARDLAPDAARRLAAEGKAVVWIDFGLHSSEVAHAQSAPLMAYEAVTSASEEMRAIREHVIFLLVPNMNPDGTTLVSEWYMKHVGTPFERSALPELYHKYVGHDNNRDWFMFNMPESRNVARQLYVEWFPQIVYNQHQAAPFPARIFVPPFDDPMNPNIPALVMRGVNLVGDAITRRLEQEGKVGAISRLSFDTWWNGGMRTAPYYHNMIGILTETAHPSATPSTYDPKRFPKTFSNGIPTLEPTTYYPSPYLGGEWRLRDSCDYMISASVAVLDIAAKRRQEWLSNIYEMGRAAIEQGAGEAYVVPRTQWDPGAAIRMINVLRLGGVEVHRATAPFTAAGRAIEAGSFVIQAAQPFRPYLTDLLNPQVYPDLRLYPGGPPKRPYDITGWTLPLQMGVEVHRVQGALDAVLEPLDAAEAAEPELPASAGYGIGLDPRANDAFTAVNRLLAAGVEVRRLHAPLETGGAAWPAGTFVVPQSEGAAARLPAAVDGLSVPLVGLSEAPAGESTPLRSPRLGLYHGYGGNMDEGWTRWILERFEFPYVSLYDRQIREGRLRRDFDVIVLPDAGYDRMLAGLPADAAPPEYVGGMTIEGISNLYAFVREGGVLVALDTAAELPLAAFGLPITDVTDDRPAADFYIPGTLLAIDVDPAHPVGYGMPERAVAFFAHSPAFSLGRSAAAGTEAPEREAPGVRVVARYPADSLLESGWILGEEVIARRAAVVEAELGQGRVILIGFRAQHRGQPHGTFKLLFNSLLLAPTGP